MRAKAVTVHKRERILDLWAKGLSSPVIAERLGCNTSYVTACVAWARNRGDARAISRLHNHVVAYG